MFLLSSPSLPCENLTWAGGGPGIKKYNIGSATTEVRIESITGTQETLPGEVTNATERR